MFLVLFIIIIIFGLFFLSFLSFLRVSFFLGFSSVSQPCPGEDSSDEPTRAGTMRLASRSRAGSAMGAGWTGAGAAPQDKNNNLEFGKTQWHNVEYFFFGIVWSWNQRIWYLTSVIARLPLPVALLEGRPAAWLVPACCIASPMIVAKLKASGRMQGFTVEILNHQNKDSQRETSLHVWKTSTQTKSRNWCGDRPLCWAWDIFHIKIIHRSPSKSHVGTIAITFKSGVRQLQHEALTWPA